MTTLLECFLAIYGRRDRWSSNFRMRYSRTTQADGEGEIFSGSEHRWRTGGGGAPWRFARAAYAGSHETWRYLAEPYLFAWPGIIFSVPLPQGSGFPDERHLAGSPERSGRVRLPGPRRGREGR
jgi:hypothetical protein